MKKKIAEVQKYESVILHSLICNPEVDGQESICKISMVQNKNCRKGIAEVTFEILWTCNPQDRQLGQTLQEIDGAEEILRRENYGSIFMKFGKPTISIWSKINDQDRVCMRLTEQKKTCRKQIKEEI